jgi:hypothetical protein
LTFSDIREEMRLMHLYFTCEGIHSLVILS